MSREGALTVMIAVAVVILAVLAWSWRRRSRRDGGFALPVGEPPAGAVTIAAFRGLYVATTRHTQPLERLAIRGLGFRSRADVTVTDAGVIFDLTGQPRLFISADRIVGAAQASVAIDRVVERDGLARLDWRIDSTAAGDHTVVDSYFRPQEASARSVVDAFQTLTSPTTTGGDA